MNPSPSELPKESNMRVPDLQDIVEIHTALQSCDDTALSALLARAADPTAVQENIYRSFSVSGHYVDMGRRSPVYWHSRLWMIPLLLPPGAGAIEQVPKHCSRWLQGWMGMQPSTLLERVLTVQDVLRLQPGQTRQLLDSLTGFGPSCNMVLRDDPELEGAPRLGFIMGAVKALHREPVIPAKDFAHEARKLQSAMEFVSGVNAELSGSGIVLGGLLDFSDALVQGIQMWLQALHESRGISGWMMDLSGGGNLALTVSFQAGDGGHSGMTIPLRHWQMGHAGVEMLLEFCGRWPMLSVTSPEGGRGILLS